MNLKQLLVTIIIALALAWAALWYLGGWSAFLGLDDEEPTVIDPNDNLPGLPPPPIAGKLWLPAGSQYVSVNDVTMDPVADFSSGVVLFSDNQYYSFLYYDHDQSFLITLEDATDLRLARSLAEQAFVEQLGVSNEEVCRLHVDLIVPSYVSNELADSYGLSFCASGKPLPGGAGI